MELKIQNGDYCPDGLGGMVVVDEAEAVVQRMLFRLTARRGSFPLLPNLGSDLHRVMYERPSARQTVAEQYVRVALEEEAVSVQSVVLNRQGDRVELVVEALWQGQVLLLTKEL